MDITRAQAETIADYYLTKFQAETGFTNATEMALHQLRRHLAFLLEGNVQFTDVEEALDALHNLDRIKDGTHEDIELSPNLFIDNRLELADEFTRLYNKSLTDIVEVAGYRHTKKVAA